MENKKSDFRRFCETMWIMAKYDVLPWMVGLGIATAVIFGLQGSKSKDDCSNQQNVSKTIFQRQR